VDITPGQPPASQQVTVTNSNPQPLVITGVQASAPFSATPGTCSTGQSIPARGSCSITVQFAPTALGVSTATLTIDSSAGQSAAQLSGTGFVKLMIMVVGGGTVQGDDGASCSSPDPNGCADQVTAPITLTATPTATGGKPTGFKGWRGGACVAFGANQKCGPLGLTADASATAVFSG